MTEGQTKAGQTIKANCATCSGLRNCEIMGYHAEADDDGLVTFWLRHYILKCKGCDYSFFLHTSANSEDIDYSESPDGTPDLAFNEQKTYWPSLLKRPEPSWFPVMKKSKEYDSSKLDQPLFELYVALNNDLNILTAIAVRTCFDVVSEVCKVDESLPFAEKINELVKQGRIGIAQKARLGALIDAGGASAHRGWVPDLAEINLLVDLLEDFLQNLFAVPDLQRDLDEKAAKLSANVPPKKKRLKPAKK